MFKLYNVIKYKNTPLDDNYNQELHKKVACFFNGYHIF